MKIIYNKFLPPKGFAAINLFGILFARSENNPLRETTINHEAIHSSQAKEMLFIFFYLWYCIEWLVRWVQYGSRSRGYFFISFEQEAYKNQYDSDYIKNRTFWSFLKYL